MDNLSIRAAKAEDVDLIFNWANDEDARRFSFTKDPIPYETHCN